MPHFEEHYAKKLLGTHGISDAEAVLDLRKLTREKAAATLAHARSAAAFATMPQER